MQAESHAARNRVPRFTLRGGGYGTGMTTTRASPAPIPRSCPAATRPASPRRTRCPARTPERPRTSSRPPTLLTDPAPMPDRQSTPSEVRIRGRPRGAGHGPDPRDRGVPRGPATTGEAPAGDDRRLADRGVHECRRLPHRPVVAGHRGVRAGAGRGPVPVPDVRVARRTRRAPLDLERFARPSRSASGTGSTSGRSSRPGCGPGTTWTGWRTTGNAATVPPPRRRAVRSTTWRCTPGTSSTRSCSPPRSSPADSAAGRGPGPVAAGRAPPGPGRLARAAAGAQGTRGRTVLDAATAMSKGNEGIETLVVILGSNNALGSVVYLERSGPRRGTPT